VISGAKLDVFVDNTVVALFLINIASPVFIVAENFVNCRLVVGSIVVGSSEMVPMVFLLRVFVTSGRKIKTKPGFDLFNITDLLQVVYGRQPQTTVHQQTEYHWSQPRQHDISLYDQRQLCG
jgi:hypothetical protein